MPRVAKFDTSNPSPTQQIITRLHQALYSHYSARIAQHPHVIHLICIYGYSQYFVSDVISLDLHLV